MMASMVGGMKVKSKSDSGQPGKMMMPMKKFQYRSMALRRQEGALNITSFREQPTPKMEENMKEEIGMHNNKTSRWFNTWTHKQWARKPSLKKNKATLQQNTSLPTQLPSNESSESPGLPRRSSSVSERLDRLAESPRKSCSTSEVDLRNVTFTTPDPHIDRSKSFKNKTSRWINTWTSKQRVTPPSLKKNKAALQQNTSLPTQTPDTQTSESPALPRRSSSVSERLDRLAESPRKSFSTSEVDLRNVTFTTPDPQIGRSKSFKNRTSRWINTWTSKQRATPPSLKKIKDTLPQNTSLPIQTPATENYLSPGLPRRANSTSERLARFAETSSQTSAISTVELTDLSASQTDFLPQTPCQKDSLAENQIIRPHPQVYFTLDSRKLASKHCSRKSVVDNKLLHGVKKFNLDPKRGLDYLHRGGFLKQDSAEEVASFLYREGRLSKKQIGAYIGAHHDFNQSVLAAFVAMHQFTHLILVQALRQFLWSFRLPGEAMQIDRIMESFAKHYCAQNPNLFEETDTCYLLSFSIIMLNTALHNPNVKKKITCEEFVKQNRGLNSGKDLPRDILELIYRNIKEEPFKIPDETYDDLMYTFFSPEKEGWLLKQGGSWKNWKRRWFVLSDRCLYYFQHTAENVPKGIIPLENVKVREIDDRDRKHYVFEIYSENTMLVKGCKTDSNGTVVQGNHKSYRMSATSEADRNLWVKSIQDSIKEHPFYDTIRAKKAALRRKSISRQHDIPSSTEPTITQ